MKGRVIVIDVNRHSWRLRRRLIPYVFTVRLRPDPRDWRSTEVLLGIRVVARSTWECWKLYASGKIPEHAREHA